MNRYVLMFLTVGLLSAAHAQSKPSEPFPAQRSGSSYCDEQYKRCTDGCKRKKKPKDRALCYSQCMEEYSRCLDKK